MQWGATPSGSPQIYKQTLPIAYINKYTVTLIDVAGSPNGTEVVAVGVDDYGRTTTYFYVIGNFSNRASAAHWHTMGY